MQEFKKYNSLTLIRESREEELQRIKDLTHGIRFVVTEKIHGANFQVTTNGSQVEFARRRGVLVEGESFYGYQYIAEPLTSKIKEMHKDLKEMTMEQHRVCDLAEAEGHEVNRPELPRDFQELSIRGEFAGGHYPAEGVVEVKVGNGQVGKGKIWYGQDKSFFAFEICVDGTPLDLHSVGALCISYGVPLVPVLFFGTFEECLEYSKAHLDSPSVVPQMQPLLNEKAEPIVDETMGFKSLPHLPDNIREGHVIASVEPKWLPNGKRMTFKHKGAKFMENKGSKVQKAKPTIEFTEQQQFVFDAVLPLLTENRMEAVMSKEELSESKDFPKVCGLVIQDAVDELFGYIGEANGFINAWDGLSTKERKRVTGQLGRECTSRLRVAYFN